MIESWQNISNYFGRMHQRENHLSFRSIDIFADRHTKNIADLYDGVIEIMPIPTVEEFNTHIWGEEFYACIIEQAEFEAIWERRFYDGDGVLRERRNNNG